MRAIGRRCVQEVRGVKRLQSRNSCDVVEWGWERECQKTKPAGTFRKFGCPLSVTRINVPCLDNIHTEPHSKNAALQGKPFKLLQVSLSLTYQLASAHVAGINCKLQSSPKMPELQLQILTNKTRSAALTVKTKQVIKCFLKAHG